MKSSCIVCGTLIFRQSNINYCTKCGSSYDSQMRFIPARHNWNLEDYSKNFSKVPELSNSKHQS